MSGYDDPRTRATERVEGHDPSPNLGSEDFRAIVERDSEMSQTSLALATHAEIVDTPILDRIVQAQQNAFLQVARDHPLISGTPLTDEGVIERVNEFQIGTTAEQAAYIEILNESVDTAAAQLEGDGFDSYSFWTALTRAGESAGQNFVGAAVDMANMSVSQQLTIVGAAVLGYMIPSRHNGLWSLGMGTLATIILSPHAGALATSIGGAVLRTGTQAVAAPLRIGMRGTEVINDLLSPDLIQSTQNQIYGTGTDLANSFSYILDSDFNPENNPEANPAMLEFLSLGREYAPPEITPLLDYLTALRTGQIAVEDLPSRAELETAGRYLAQVEGLVTEEEYLLIEQKRITAQPLTDEEKRQYVIFKYTLMVNGAFMDEGALQPQASVVRAAYERASNQPFFNSTEDALASLPAAQRTALEEDQFSWNEAQAQQFQNQAEQMGLDVNFQNLTKHGFVGLALNLYIAMTVIGVLVGGAKNLWGARRRRRERLNAERILPEDKKTLTESQQTAVRNSLSEGSNRVKTVVTALVEANVLVDGTDFDSAIQSLELPDLDPTALETLRSVANNGDKTRKQLRDSFFALIQPALSNTTQREALESRRGYYHFRGVLNRMAIFYRYGPRGATRNLEIGEETLTITRPAERRAFRFSTVDDILRGINPRNFIRSLTDDSEGLTVRLDNNKYLYIRRNESGAYEYNTRATRYRGWREFNLTEGLEFRDAAE